MKDFLTSKLKVFVALFVIMQLAAWIFSNVISREHMQSGIFIILSGGGVGAALTLYTCYLWGLKEDKISTSKTLPIIIASVATLLAFPFTMLFGIYLGGSMGPGFMSLILQVYLGVESRTWLRVGEWFGVGVGSYIISVLPTLFATRIGYAIGRRLSNRIESG